MEETLKLILRVFSISFPASWSESVGTGQLEGKYSDLKEGKKISNRFLRFLWECHDCFPASWSESVGTDQLEGKILRLY